MCILPQKSKVIKRWCLLACRKWTSSLSSYLETPHGYSKLVKPTYRKLWCLSMCIKSDNAKVLHTYYLEYFRHAWSCPSNMIVSIVKNFNVYLHKKSILSLAYSLKYCKEFATLMFWVLWTWVTMPIKVESISL